MPFNDVGTYSLPQSPFVSGTAILAAAFDSNLSDIAASLSTLDVTGALSIKGRATNSAGVYADISATDASGAVLRENSNVLGFGTVATAGIANSAITLAKMESRAQATVIGRAAGAGTGVPQELSAGAVQSVLRGVTGFVSGSGTRDLTTATGTQAFTGVGFQPKAGIFLTSFDAGSVVCSYGITDASVLGGFCLYVDYTALTIVSSSSVPIIISNASPSSGNYQAAFVTSWDADGFTLSWTKVGSPTGTAKVQYFVIR